jgi:large-conductance mechanosensitive channel
MDTYTQTQVFFFISSVGFVVLWIFTAVFLFYLIRATNTLSRILEKAEKDINDLGETTKEIIEEIRDNKIFNFLFGKKRRSRKN